MLKFYIYVTLIIAQFAAKRLAPSRFLCTPIKVMHVVACFFFMFAFTKKGVTSHQYARLT